MFTDLLLRSIKYQCFVVKYALLCSIFKTIFYLCCSIIETHFIRRFSLT